MTKILVTGASGQLGRKTVDALARTVPASDIAVLLRSQEAADGYSARGFDVRMGDYTDAPSLEAAFAGIDRLLLISSSEIGQRTAQHANVVASAKTAGVGFIAYTSILRATENPMQLAGEHKATEALIADSGIAHTILRNGWYTENLTYGLPQILEMGQHFGAAGTGKVASATRQDYAEAAAAVLTGPGHEGKIYELGGDASHTKEDFVAAVAAASGKDIAYVDMPEAAFHDALTGAGLPGPLAAMFADSDARTAEGWLDTTSTDLRDLIGRGTTPMTDTITAAVAEL